MAAISPITQKRKRAEKETQRLRDELNAEQRAGAEMVAARKRARGGARAMLSDARINPEEGVTTLGATGL